MHASFRTNNKWYDVLENDDQIDNDNVLWQEGGWLKIEVSRS